MSEIARIKSDDVDVAELEELGELIAQATGGSVRRDGDEVRVTSSHIPKRLRGRHPVTWHPLKWLREQLRG